MAYTLEQSVTGVVGSADEIIFVVKDTTNTAEPKYRYACQVTINSTVIGVFKQLPNNADCAVFNISQIVAPYLEQEENAWRLGLFDTTNTLQTVRNYSLNAQAIETVTLDFGYEFAATVNDSPVLTLGQASGSFRGVNGSLTDPISAYGVTSIGVFQLNGSTKRFLSDVTSNSDGIYTQWVAYGSAITQFGSLAFLNGDDVGSTGSGYAHVSYYASDGSALNTAVFKNTPAYGGKEPALGLTDGQSLLYLGCFPFNLEGQTIASTLKPSDAGNAGWAYYDLQFASSLTLSGNQTSAIYRFRLLPCNRYQNAGKIYTLAWWNSVGGIDQLVFDGLSKVSQNIERSKFRQRGGNAFNANGGSSPYSLEPYEGGVTSAGNNTTTSITLNTQALNPNDVTPLMKSMLNSERVYIYGSDLGSSINSGKENYVRAFVTDSSITYKEGINDKTSSYSVTVEISRRRANP
tara:strand:+ start:8454 stop:9839 length:1386 start_codon:yes stop_codon:yes gene_type:complete